MLLTQQMREIRDSILDSRIRIKRGSLSYNPQSCECRGVVNAVMSLKFYLDDQTRSFGSSEEFRTVEDSLSSSIVT